MGGVNGYERQEKVFTFVETLRSGIKQSSCEQSGSFGGLQVSISSCSAIIEVRNYLMPGILATGFEGSPATIQSKLNL